MKSPHVSPEPLPYLPDRVSNLVEKSSSCSTGSLKTGGWAGKGKVTSHFSYKKKSSSLTKENLDEFNRYTTSPYYRGLLFQEKVLGTCSEAENNTTTPTPTPIPHDFQDMSSPYYKGLLYTEKVPDIGITLEAESATTATATTATATTIPHEFTTTYSPYYKGLLYTEKVPGTGITLEAESTTTTATAAAAIPHEFTTTYSKDSPYYKGLLYTEKVPGTGITLEAESATTATATTTATAIPHEFTTTYSPYYKGLLNQATSPDRESVATTAVSSSSRMSFAIKMPELGCFKFKTKDEKPPTMVKVYSTENSNEESLRERGSEPTSPQFSPPLPPTLPSPQQPVPPPLSSVPSITNVVLTAKDDTIEPKDGNKYVWADRYRPETLKDFICNKDKAIELQQTIKDEECRHFIFEGQAGVGKRTMIWALLRDAYGADKVQARDECKTFNLKGEDVSSIIVNVKESSQHVEVNLSELKGFEKHVIVELIKEANMLTNKARCDVDNCRAIILHEADKLSTDALLYIRWVIERYRGCHKVFFCCQDASKLKHLQNICTLIKFLPPSNKEIVEVLELIARKENIELPRQLAERIAINSKNNLRQAIRSFEASWHHNSLLEGDQIILTGWEDDIAYIAKSIVEKQNPKQLYLIRQKLQNLIDHSVPPEFIFETLEVELKKNVDESMHMQIEKTHKEYTDKGSKSYSNDERKKLIQQFMNIEEFIAKFMSCYKNHLAKQTLDMTETATNN